VLTSLLEASTPRLPVDVEMTAEYTGAKQVKLVMTLSAKEDMEMAVNISSNKGLIEDSGQPAWKGKLTPTDSKIIEKVCEFERFDEYVEINIEMNSFCEECTGTFLQERSFCVVLLKEGPWLTTMPELTSRMMSDESFAERLGAIIVKSKLHEKGKGLFEFRAMGMSLEQAKAAHKKMFGSLDNLKEESEIPSKTKNNSTRLSSIISRNGRIAYYDSKYQNTYGLPRASVAVVVFSDPGYEALWGYATTDDNGYYTVNFDVPNGQTIQEMLVGFQIHTEDTTDNIAVREWDTNQPCMLEGIGCDGNYNVNIDSTFTFYGRARLHWSIIQSYIFACANGFGVGDVNVYWHCVCGSSEACYDYGSTINVCSATGGATQSLTAHEHGHHIMFHKSNYINGTEWQLCDDTNAGNAVSEGWAEFWAHAVFQYPYKHMFITYSYELESNAYCSGVKSIYKPTNITRVFWDLYDGVGSADEYWSFWLGMDDAMTSPIYDIYDYIDNLKNHYASEVISALIDTTAYLNIPHPQQLLLASKTDANLFSLPKSFSLSQNYPNPFNPSTSISYYLSQFSQNVSLRVYDVRGKIVRVLIEGKKEAGSYTVFWDGTDDQGKEVSSGVYFYRLSADGLNNTRKMVLLK